MKLSTALGISPSKRDAFGPGGTRWDRPTLSIAPRLLDVDRIDDDRRGVQRGERDDRRAARDHSKAKLLCRAARIRRTVAGHLNERHGRAEDGRGAGILAHAAAPEANVDNASDAGSYAVSVDTGSDRDDVIGAAGDADKHCETRDAAAEKG